MSPAVRKVIAYCDTHDIEIVSYGLQPNPNGFCFERGENTSAEACRKLSAYLDGLTRMEEQELKAEVFGL